MPSVLLLQETSKVLKVYFIEAMEAMHLQLHLAPSWSMRPTFNLQLSGIAELSQA